jgi:hypothetical protein
MALPSPSETSRRAAFAALRASLDPALLAAPRVRPEDLLSAKVPTLDRLIGGGFPRGTLVTLEGRAGRWTIAARLLAVATTRSTVAVIDDGGLYPPALANAGACLERVLIVPARSPLAAARAADILLRSRACRLVLMPAPDLRPAIWMRLSSLANRTGVVLIAIPSSGTSAAVALAAAAGMRLHCTRERTAAAGNGALWCRFCGYTVCAELRKYKTPVSEVRAHLQAIGDVALR